MWIAGWHGDCLRRHADPYSYANSDPNCNAHADCDSYSDDDTYCDSDTNSRELTNCSRRSGVWRRRYGGTFYVSI